MINRTATNGRFFNEPIKSSLALITELEAFTKALTKFQFEGKCSFARNAAAVEESLKLCRRDFSRHYLSEEQIVFPFLEKHIPRLSSLMRFFTSEHRILARLTDEMFSIYEKINERNQSTIARNVLISEFREVAFQFIYLLKHHLKEELEKIYSELRDDLKRYEYNALRNQVEMLI